MRGASHQENAWEWRGRGIALQLKTWEWRGGGGIAPGESLGRERRGHRTRRRPGNSGKGADETPPHVP